MLPTEMCYGVPVPGTLQLAFPVSALPFSLRGRGMLRHFLFVREESFAILRGRGILHHEGRLLFLMSEVPLYPKPRSWAPPVSASPFPLCPAVLTPRLRYAPPFSLRERGVLRNSLCLREVSASEKATSYGRTPRRSHAPPPCA